MTVSQHARHQEPENVAAKLNPAIINLVIHTCAFPAVKRQTVFCKKKKNPILSKQGFCQPAESGAQWLTQQQLLKHTQM